MTEPNAKSSHEADFEEMDGFGPPSRYVYLVGDVTEQRIRGVVQQIFFLAEKDLSKPITLVVNTMGGLLYDIFALYDAVKIITPCTVRTLGLGKIMSAGCLALACGTKGERRMGKNAKLMYHAGHDLLHGDVLSIQSDLEEFKRVQDQYDSLVAIETGKTLEAVRSLYLPKRLDTYLSSEEALQFGFVDQLVG